MVFIIKDALRWCSFVKTQWQVLKMYMAPFLEDSLDKIACSA